MTSAQSTRHEREANHLQAHHGSNGLPPYHLFEKDGKRFAYFVERDCSFCIDRPAFALLSRALHTSLPEAARALIDEGTFPRDMVVRVLDEAKRLERAGLFRPPRNTLPKEAMERALEHRYTTPWTRLELALAESCNLACTYCYCSAVRDMPNQGLMSEDVARKAIDWLFKVSGDSKDLSLTLFGGEPLLNKPVFKFVMDYSDDLARRHGKTIHYSMTTNGTLIDDMVIHYIKKHNFGLMVSLDGPPEIHDKQCPTQAGGPSFELAAAGIKRLMRRRKSVTVRCTVTNSRPRLMDLVHFFNEFGFTRIVLGRAQNPLLPTEVDCSSADFDVLERQEEEELIPWMLKELEAGRIPTWFPYGDVLKKPEPDPSEVQPLKLFRCGACRGTSTVGGDGRLYPCHRFVGMQNFVMGHIDDGPDIEFAKDFWRTYDAAVDSKCSGCWARRACNRPCPWTVAQADGTFRPPEDHECARILRYIERGIFMHQLLANDHSIIRQQLSSIHHRDG